MDSLSQPVDTGAVRHIGLDEKRFTTSLSNRICHPLALSGKFGDHNLRPQPGKGSGDLFADAAPSPGDNHHLAAAFGWLQL